MSDYVRCKHCGSILSKKAALAWRAKNKGNAVVSGNMDNASGVVADSRTDLDSVEKAMIEALSETKYAVNPGNADGGVTDLKVEYIHDHGDVFDGMLFICYGDTSTAWFDDMVGNAASDISATLDGAVVDINGSSWTVNVTEHSWDNYRVTGEDATNIDNFDTSEPIGDEDFEFEDNWPLIAINFELTKA